MATSRVTTRDNLREAETSPDGRYVRFDEKLGNGAYKDVFLSYDTETGKEVAWNAVDLRRMPNIERKRIRSETEILKSLSHPHIINFYHVWDNVEKDQICFTTEIVTSGTLKQYTSRVKCVKLKVIKKWCRQILAGLDYLHSHNPPIIHRDLKCDNIFINGSTGEIRIGDFGLSTARHKTHTESVLGTPEFMAPELYDEHYSEKVDIYAFGMCVLEMTTKEYPYEECMNAAQIWKRVSAGQKPDVLNRIKDPQVRAFLDLCLMPQHVRLSAHDLLKHPFLSFKHCDPIRDNIAVAVEERKNVCTEVDEEDDPQQRTRDLLASNAQQAAKQRKDESPDGRQIPPTINTVTSMQQPIQVINTAQPTPPTAAAAATTTTASTATTTPTPQPTTSTPVAHPSTVSTSTDMVVSHIVVEVEGTKDHIAHIVLHIHFEARRKKQIKFDFHMHEDTSDAIASEMVRALNLPEPAHTTQLIAQAIESKVEPYRQLWLTQSNAIPTTEPHDVRSQTPSPTPDNVVPTVQQHFTYETTAISTTEQYQQPTTAEGYTHPSTTVPTTAAYYPHPGTSSPHHPGRRVSYADAVNGAITPHQHVMSPHHSPASSPSQTARRLDPHHLPHPPPHAQHLPPPYEHTYDPASNPYPPHHDGTPPHHYDPHHPSYPHHSTPSPSDTGYYTPTQSQSTHDLHHTHPATHYPHYDPHHPHHIHPSHHHSTYTLPSPAPDLHTGPPSYIHASASEPHLPQPYHPPASHHDYGDPNYVYNPHEQHTYPPSHHTSSHATHTTHAAHYTPDTHFSSASSLHSEPSYPPHATPSPDPYHDPHYQHPYHMHRGTPYYPPPHTTAYTPREAHKPPTKPPSHPHHHTLPRPSSAAPLMPTYDPHHPPHHEPSSRVPHGMKRSDTSRGALPAPASQHDLDREHHDRCYEKYSKLTVAQLKELIKETGQGAQYESLDNKNDLIEAFIKLTPLCATQSTSTTSLKRSESADVLSMKSAHAALAIMTPEEHLTTRPNLSRDGSVSPPENSSPRGQYTTHTHPNGHHPYPPHTAHPPHPSLPPHGHPHPHAYPNGTYYPSTAAGTPQHYSTHDLYANGAPPPQPQTRRSDSPVQQHPHPHALPHPAAHPPPSSHPPHPHHVDSNGAYVTYPDLQSGGDMLGHVVHDGATTATSHQPSPSSQAQPPSQPSHPYPPHTQHPPHGHHLPTSTSHPQGYPPKASFPHSASTQHLAVPEYSPNTHARALSPNTYLTPSSSTSSFTSEASYDEHHPMSSPPSQHPSQPYPPRNGTYPHPYPYPHHPPPPHAYPHYPPHPQYHPHSYPSHPIHHGHSSNNLLPHQQPSPSPPAPSHQSAPYPSTHQQHTAHTHPQTQAPPPHHVPPYQPQPQPHPQSQPHPPPQSQQPPQHQAPPPTQPPPQPIHPSHPQPQPSPPPQSHSVPHPHPHPHPHPQQMPYSDVSTNMNGKTTPTLQASPKLAAASLSLPPATASIAPRRNSQLEQHSFSSHHLDTQPTTQPPSTAGHSRSNTISHDINVNDLNPDMAKKLEQAKIKEQKMMAAKEKARLEASKAEASILASFSLT